MNKNIQYTPDLLKERVQQLSNLSTLPYIAAKVMELVENPKTSASNLGKIISADQVLAGRILKLANSAYYGFPRKISTINLAIVILGFNTLRDLVLSISVVDQFKIKNNTLLHIEDFWRHALIVGMGARLISRYLNYPIVGEVFVAGLLHDIGYLVLFQRFSKLFRKIYQTAHQEEISFLEAEKKTMDITHAEIGSWLADGWNLPTKLVKAIRYHHEPDKIFQNSELANIIHIADLISYSIGEGNGLMRTIDVDEAVIEEKLKTLTQNRYSLLFFQEKLREESEKAREFLNLMVTKYQEPESVQA